MGKKWDYDVPSVEVWTEVLRVLKPGGHVLSFGGTRTYHRMVVNMEDAGFEIRDQVMWIYGSGFPKSMDISKAIDKQAGAEREVLGVSDKKWQGFGTALKPANEPICLARKPISEKTVAVNVLKHGTGGLNIDGSRIEGLSDKELNWTPQRQAPKQEGIYGGGKGFVPKEEMPMFNPQGRWPANVLFDEEAAALLDLQTQHLHGAGYANTLIPESRQGNIFRNSNPVTRHGDSGGASRFFYVAKASKKERNAGLEGMPEKEMPANGPLAWGVHNQTGKPNKPPEPQKNNHPTVKPVKLMEYLIKLVTPPNGVVLDPFMGSGSTGVAAKNLGFQFIGIEMNEEYLAIANKRVGS
jgi:site-specific DNA-methyltransferase (adenine-specific)